jgi:hypothetical protein
MGLIDIRLFKKPAMEINQIDHSILFLYSYGNSFCTIFFCIFVLY